ncbi:MAG: type II secretion system protein GspG [Planctomycetes bacterium]|nr:type II secretion system protein GspG [Planctomycetota bacterium]
MNRRPTRREAGFSLIELMVVIIIIGIIGSFAAVSLLGKTDEAKVAQAINDINVLGNAVEMYYLKHNELPESLDEIAAELKGETIPPDPWGNDYIYEKKSRRSFDIRCLGADGEEGGEEEVDKDLSYLTLSTRRGSGKTR